MKKRNNSPSDDIELRAFMEGFHFEDGNVARHLVPLLYDELRTLASQKLRYQRSNHTLNTTALVHEAYIKLSKQEDQGWQSKGHFMATATQIMRHVLINYAEKRNAQKRGGGNSDVHLDAVPEVIDEQRADLLIGLDEALQRLSAFDQRGAQIVELRFFGGFTQVEIAEMLGVTERTVRRNWLIAKTWIQKELKREDLLD